ncbi:MAG: UDP-N-acetylglucosamine 2-epimerase (non-hydrolyzing) [Kiritimatiellae bacterium]|nr:UDP-N-acetylglucosamine 2-epimerase (non-hydrolyzing) [Kiritimatiellia bacterium]
MKHIVTIVGARPQFIKAAPVCWALRQTCRETLVHTGQHYDDNMSRRFFEELRIPAPEYNLRVGSGPHGAQTAAMLQGIEEVLLREKPDLVLVYGDTNSTLAGALAACKLRVPLAHVEAGLRSYNRAMPEEHNRVLTDHCADLLFCPTETARANLEREGVTRGVHVVGDTMYDAVLHFAEAARRRPSVAGTLGLRDTSFALVTLHRAGNVDDEPTLTRLLQALARIERPVIFPVHPRTRERMRALHDRVFPSGAPSHLHVIDPVGYLDMLKLEQDASVVLTDSGGIQKEAFFLETPCITLRRETEWTETVATGWNRLAGDTLAELPELVASARRPAARPPALFGDGRAAERIAERLQSATPGETRRTGSD